MVDAALVVDVAGLLVVAAFVVVVDGLLVVVVVALVVGRAVVDEGRGRLVVVVVGFACSANWGTWGLSTSVPGIVFPGAGPVEGFLIGSVAGKTILKRMISLNIIIE